MTSINESRSAASPARRISREPSEFSESIPRIFHQTWRNSDLSTHSKFAVASKKSLCVSHPDFVHYLWTDEDIEAFLEEDVRHEHTDLYKIYHELPQRIMKVDFVRYLWMYFYGGIYCDLDILCEDSFTPLVEVKSVCFFERAWTTGGKTCSISVHQAWLASRPGHPVWLDIIRACGRFLMEGETNVLDVTGPNAVSRALSERQLVSKYGDITLLPAPLFYQPGMTKTARHLACCTHEATFTWRDRGLVARARRAWLRVNRRIRRIFVNL